MGPEVTQVLRLSPAFWPCLLVGPLADMATWAPDVRFWSYSRLRPSRPATSAYDPERRCSRVECGWLQSHEATRVHRGCRRSSSYMAALGRCGKPRRKHSRRSAHDHRTL